MTERRSIVTYPLKRESLAEMEVRWAKGEPMQIFSFTVTSGCGDEYPPTAIQTMRRMLKPDKKC